MNIPFQSGDLVKVLTPTKSKRRFEIAFVDKVNEENKTVTIIPHDNRRARETVQDVSRILKIRLLTLHHKNRHRLFIFVFLVCFLSFT